MRARTDIPQLTGIRAIAAAWVVLFHAERLIRPLLPEFAQLERLTKAGYLGVDLFFVLSGFIIAHNYLDRFETPSWARSLEFLKARLARIYPVHVATLGVVALGLVTASLTGRSYGSPDQHRLDQLVLHVLLLHDWVWAAAPSWNLPSWSISAEWFAYLGFLGLSPLIARIRSARGALLFAVACYAALTWTIGATTAGSLDVTTRGGLIRVGFEFSAGLLLERAHRALPENPRLWGRITLVTLASLCGVLWLRAGDGLVAALLGLLVLSLARSQGGVARALSTRTAVYGGKISYALYMTHGIVLHLFESVAAPQRFSGAAASLRWTVLLALFGALWLAADLTFRWVEEPGRLWLRRLPTGVRRVA